MAFRFELRASLGRAYRRIRGSDLTPLRFALSLAVGLWVGCLPLYGVHFFLCALLTLPLRLNFLVAYAAAHISIPPTVPFLWFAALQLGSLVLSGGWLALSWSEFTLARAGQLGGMLLLGSLLLGAILGGVGGVLAYVVARSAGARTSTVSAATQVERAVLRTAERYARAPRSARYYVRLKLLLDPLAEQLAAVFRSFLPDASRDLVIVDAGTGRGQYALFLHELGVVGTSWGFDHDAEKVALAQAAAGGLDAHFAAGDLRHAPYPPCDVVLFLDVLHYLSASEQALVLERAALALRDNGHVLVRETDDGAGFGARLALWFERVGRSFGINRGERLELVSTRRLEDNLQRAGFIVLSADRTGTLDNVLVVARKRSPDERPMLGE